MGTIHKVRHLFSKLNGSPFLRKSHQHPAPPLTPGTREDLC